MTSIFTPEHMGITANVRMYGTWELSQLLPLGVAL
jgi:hypothetical protein